MRLTILSRDAPPMVGGIADHSALLAANLAQAGDEVTLVTRHGADVIPGVDVWTHPRFDTMPPRALAQAIAGTNPNAILWAYNPFSFGKRGLAYRASLMARELAALNPKPRLVVFAHELAFPGSVGGFKGFIWHQAQARALRHVVAAADQMIVTTPDRLEQLGGNAELVPVGSNLPLTVMDAEARSRVRAELGNPGLLIAHLGGVGPGRDLHTALDAMKNLDGDIHLLLAGDTGPFLLPDQLEDRVHHPGREEPLKLAERLAAADLYLHLDPVGPTPGRRTTLVAAMQAGLPIVAYSGQQTDARLVEAQAVALVPPHDPEALANAISSLRADPEECSRLGRNALKLHQDVFDWGRITERVRSVLKG